MPTVSRLCFCVQTPTGQLFSQDLLSDNRFYGFHCLSTSLKKPVTDLSLARGHRNTTYHWSVSGTGGFTNKSASHRQTETNTKNQCWTRFTKVQRHKNEKILII